MLTNTRQVIATVGELGGVYLDTSDPDKDGGTGNIGVEHREILYCIPGPEDAKAVVIPLQASLTTSISGQGKHAWYKWEA